MRMADLSGATIERLRTVEFDQIGEKHEGPFTWDSEFKYGSPEFLTVGTDSVLLPIDPEQHANITVLKTIRTADDRWLTLFLKDTTYCDDPDWERFGAGRLALCARFEEAGQPFYAAVVYHEWYVTELPD